MPHLKNNNINNKPLILVVPDYKSGGDNQYSVKPHYAIRCNYLDMIVNSGGVAIIANYDLSAINHYLNIVDGVMIIGGGFDIDPARYNQKPHPTVKLNKFRENFEYQLMLSILERKIPFLGICNGMQLLNIVCGGTIIQHLGDSSNFINHEQSHNQNFTDYSLPYHNININKESKLYNIAKQQIEHRVNSSHHQAVDKVGNNLIASAIANDGVIEAIETINKNEFCLGVQWHPEFNSSNIDKEIIDSFIAFCKTSIIKDKL